MFRSPGQPAPPDNRCTSRVSRSVVAMLSGSLLLVLLGCRGEQAYPARPIMILCPWAAGGGTDRVSRQMAMHLEQEMGVPVSVVNATGGKGVTGHNRGLRARPDGYTLTMITFELNTMHWIGLTELTYLDCEPLLSLNEDYAALLLRGDASWQSLGELEADVRAHPETFTASGTAVGGAWHLALAGWLNTAGLQANDIIWVPSAGAGPSLQQLISGGVDMVCCSLPEARTLLEAGEVRALGVMAAQRAQGFENVPTFREQGRNWELGGWRGLAVPADTPAEIVDQLVEVLHRIVSREAEPGSFAEFMQSQKFDNTYRLPDEFVRFLAATDAKLGELLTSDAMKSVSEDRFSAMAYPSILLALLTIAVGGVIVTSWRDRSRPAGQTAGQGSTVDASGRRHFALVLLSVAIYVMLVETVGFLILATTIVLLMLVLFGTRLLPSLLIACAFAPSVYLLFAYLLRVPLPRGWLG